MTDETGPSKAKTSIKSIPLTRFEPFPGPKYLGVAAIDPGVTTGLITMWYNNLAGGGARGQITIAQVPASETSIRFIVEQIARVMSKKHGGILVYERYIARPSRHGLVGASADRALSPIAVYHEIKGYFQARTDNSDERFPPQIPTYVPQQASEMASFSDKRIKAMFPDIWALTCNPAIPHGRDALRHLLVYLKREHFPLYQALKPQD